MTEIERSTHLWPDQWRGPWLVELESLPIAGRWEPVGLYIHSHNVPESEFKGGYHHQTPVPLTTAVLRGLRIGALIQRHRSTIALRGAYRAVTASAETDQQQFLSKSRVWSAAAHDPKPGRPQSWTPDRLREVAQVYRDAWGRGAPPTTAVAVHFDKSLSFAAKLVSQARQAGLLPKTHSGRAWAGSTSGNDDAQ